LERIEDDVNIRTGVCPNAGPDQIKRFGSRPANIIGFRERNSTLKIVIWLSLSMFPLITLAMYFLYPIGFITIMTPVLVLIYLGPPLILLFSIFYICYRVGGRFGRTDSDPNTHVKGWVEMAIGRDSIKGPIGSKVDRERSSRISSLSTSHPKRWHEGKREE